MTAITPEKNIFSLGVRDFAGYVYRTGGLGGNQKYDDSGSESDIHSRFIKSYIKKFSNHKLMSEYTLKLSTRFSEFAFNLSGRADIIRINDSSDFEVIEIKGLYGKELEFPERTDFVHLAQARLYAYMFMSEQGLSGAGIKITVCYVNSSSFKAKYFTEESTEKEISDFFYNTCREFFQLFSSINNYKKLRDDSILKLTFPYNDLRQGQRDFMEIALSSLKNKSPVMIQAPTGTGKTVSALYPSIKSLRHNICDHIFYLTAKTSTRHAAVKCINDMRSRGLVIKSICITAKEKICLCRDIFCDTSICQYSLNYYNNSKKALKELLKHDFIDSDIITEVALEHEVCPFEISLDISLFCDIIICDYNYFFDPRVFLERFFLNDILRFSILVDESHNLPKRANEMYSSELLLSEFLNAYGYKSLLSEKSRNNLDLLNNYFLKINESFLSKSPVFDSSISPDSVIRSENTYASRKPPKDLLKILFSYVNNAGQDFDKINDSVVKQKIKALYFSCRFFLKVASEYFSEDYILFIQKNNEEIIVALKCLNSSGMISRKSNGKSSLLFFSATLQPSEYFRKLLHSDSSDYSLSYHRIPYPFPKENLYVGVINNISVKYRDRIITLKDICNIINVSVSIKKGNYIVFLPSFEYMERVTESFIPENKNFKIIKQRKNMSEKEKNSFLEEFERKSKTYTLVAFAVLGGTFSEGIDLAGDNLSGVIITGTGIPPGSFFQEILKDYYSHVFGNGYNFAYRYPGFNKVLQASGRVIRTETDKGFIILIDERYSLPEYKSVFPEEWIVNYPESAEELKDNLNNFFILQ